MARDRVAALPTELRGQLRQATLIADLDAVLALLGQVEAHDAGVAAALRGLAERFDCQKNLELPPAEGADA